MKAVIICNDFPPLNSIGADRPYSWYVYFKKYGIEPVIITKNWKKEITDFTEVIDNIHTETTVEESDFGTIIRVPHNTIAPEKLLAKYGINKFSTIRKIITFIYKFLSFHCSFFDQHKNVYIEAKKYVQQNKVDVIITTSEPFILCKYGKKLTKTYHIPWIADYRDGWFVNHVTSISTSILVKLLRQNEWNCEKKWLQHATAISTVDTLLAKKLSDLHSKKALVCYNGFWKIFDKHNYSINPNKLILTHTGTLTPGQRVEFLIEAVTELCKENKITTSDISIQFIGLEYFPLQLQRVQNLAKEISNCIIATARIPSQEAIQKNQESDFLLTFTEETNSAIYAKTYSYIASSKQILVIPNDNSILGGLIEQHNLGYTFNSVQDIKSFLLEKIKAKKEGVLQSDITSQESVQFFSREKQSEEYVTQIKQHVII